ncbi:hypothetical protein HGRIS_000134 [Hohenbuehelia grisea]|uniref:Cytochrome P450 n=1 Tax=Hohenbuehelia grisea TaxID=104357 RepID=A0ABR3JRQ0_9AGAR
MIFAATDTTSGGMARLMHLLATHQDVQERLRAEVAEARKKFGHRELTHDELNTLPFLDGIVRETLRLHPPVTAIQRTTNTDMMLPLSKPIIDKNGNELREVFVPKDTDLIISIISSNRNKDIWGEDAEEWKPERWLKPLPDSLINAKIPGTTSHIMTFLGGSRGCIGFKFSQIELKVALSVLLEKFKVDLSDKKIRWDMNLITNPMLADNSSTRPQMPLMFSLLQSEV